MEKSLFIRKKLKNGDGRGSNLQLAEKDAYAVSIELLVAFCLILTTVLCILLLLCQQHSQQVNLGPSNIPCHVGGPAN